MLSILLARHTSCQISGSSQSSESTTSVLKSCFSLYRVATRFHYLAERAGERKAVASRLPRPSSVWMKTGAGAQAPNVGLAEAGVSVDQHARLLHNVFLKTCEIDCHSNFLILIAGFAGLVVM
jgi:hypothetical protein